MTLRALSLATLCVLLVCATQTTGAAEPPPLPEGGTPMLPADVLNNADILKKGDGSAAKHEFVDVAGQPFTRALRVTVPKPINPPRNIEMKFRSATPFKKGDTLLLSVWFRGNESIGAEHEATGIFIVQKGPPTYAKMLRKIWVTKTNWRRFDMPFSATEDSDASGMEVAIQLGGAKQIAEIGSISLINYGAAVKPEALPATRITYGGMEPDAPWRKEAAARIEQHRKGDLSIQVVDGVGKPVSGAAVSVRMKRHAFAFGTVVNRWLFDGERSPSVAPYGGPHLAVLQSDGPVNITQTPPGAEIGTLTQSAKRYSDMFTLTEFPASLQGLTTVTMPRGHTRSEGVGYSFTADRDVTVYLLVHDRGTPTLPAGWEKTDLKSVWTNNRKDVEKDTIYRRKFAAGRIEIPQHDGSKSPTPRPNPEDVKKYRETILKYFTRVSTENNFWHTWRDLEERAKGFKMVDWFLANNLEHQGIFLLQPQMRYEGTLEEVMARTLKEIEEKVPAFKGKVVEWVGINHAARWDPEPMPLEFQVKCLKRAMELDPEIRMHINDNFVLNGGDAEEALARPEGGGRPGDQERPGLRRKPMEEKFKYLVSQGVRLTGMGCQSHFDHRLTSIPKVWEVLEHFGQFIENWQISEYDIVTGDEEIEAAYTRDFLTICFSHPKMNAWIMWGFWDGCHWKDNSPMFRQDWSLKPAGKEWINLVFKEWWTETDGTTNADGAYAVRGFLGDYEITVKKDGRTQTVPAKLVKSGSSVKVVLQ